MFMRLKCQIINLQKDIAVISFDMLIIILFLKVFFYQACSPLLFYLHPSSFFFPTRLFLIFSPFCLCLSFILFCIIILQHHFLQNHFSIFQFAILNNFSCFFNLVSPFFAEVFSFIQIIAHMILIQNHLDKIILF